MNINWIPSPCKDCEDRDIKCHSTCEKFLEYRKKHEAEKTRQFKERAIDSVIRSMNINASKSNRKMPLPLRHGKGKK